MHFHVLKAVESFAVPSNYRLPSVHRLASRHCPPRENNWALFILAPFQKTIDDRWNPAASTGQRDI
jgi:hypothetical protein